VKNSKFYISGILLLAIIMPSAFAADLIVDSVNVDPTPAIPGDDLRIWVHVKNNVTDQAKDAFVRLDLQDPLNERTTDFPFSLSPGDSETRELGDVLVYETVVESFTIQVAPDALDGDYKIFFVLGEEGFDDKRISYTIKILNREPQIEIVNVTPTEVMPGANVPLDITVKNIGPGTAYSLTAGIEEDRTVTTTGSVVERLISPIGPSFDYTDKLNSGDETTLTINLSVDNSAEIKTYTVPVTIKYSDTNRTETSITRYLGIRVNEMPEIDAVVSEVTPRFTPGVSSEISVDLLNIGASEARNISINVSSDLSDNIHPEKIFIGSLESDDFDAFSTTVSVPADASLGKHTLTIEIDYRNANFEPMVITKQLPIQVVSFEEAFPGAGAAAAFNIVFLIIIVIIGYWIYRKKFRKKK